MNDMHKAFANSSRAENPAYMSMSDVNAEAIVLFSKSNSLMLMLQLLEKTR